MLLGPTPKLNKRSEAGCVWRGSSALRNPRPSIGAVRTLRGRERTGNITAFHCCQSPPPGEGAVPGSKVYVVV